MKLCAIRLHRWSSGTTKRLRPFTLEFESLLQVVLLTTAYLLPNSHHVFTKRPPSFYQKATNKIVYPRRFELGTREEKVVRTDVFAN